MLNINTLKTGSIVLFHKVGFLPFMIRTIANTDYNHAAVLLKKQDVDQRKSQIMEANIYYDINQNDKYYIAEALADGVKLIPLKLRLIDPKYSEKVRIYEPIYDNFDIEQFWTDLFFISGREYDYQNTFWAQLIYNLFGIWIGPKTEQQALKKLNCYEVIWYIHRHTKTFTEIKGQWWRAKVNAIIKNKYKEFKLVYDSNFPHQLPV